MHGPYSTTQLVHSQGNEQGNSLRPSAWVRTQPHDLFIADATSSPRPSAWVRTQPHDLLKATQ